MMSVIGGENIRMQNTLSLQQCSCCGKKLKSIKIITKVNISVSSFYIRRDNCLEDMNGLSKSVNEFLCEDCFDRFVDYIEQFSDTTTSAATSANKVSVTKTVAKKKSPAVKSAATKSSVSTAKKTVTKSLPAKAKRK